MAFNYKGNLLELLQSRVVSVSDNIEFITPQFTAPFICTIVLKNICPGAKFVGRPSSSKKEAEKSAAQRIMEDYELVNHIRRWESPEIASNIVPTGEDALAKGRLLEIFQKKGLPIDMVKFDTPQVVSPFQCTITIPEIFPGSEFVGFPCRTKKDAEKSAATIVLSSNDYVEKIWDFIPHVQDRGPSCIVSDDIMAAKGKLLEIIQKKGIPTDAVVFDTIKIDNYFQCTLRFEAVFGDQTFVGGFYKTKKDAEKAAAQTLLIDNIAMGRLCEWVPPSYIKIKSEDFGYNNYSNFGTGSSITSSSGITSTSSNSMIPKSEAKGKLLELLQKKGFPVSFAVFDSRQNISGLFECRLRVENVFPRGYFLDDFYGGPCTTKKEAEKMASLAFLQHPAVQQFFSDVEPFGKGPQQFLNLNTFSI